MNDDPINCSGLSEREFTNMLYSAAEIYPFIVKANQLFSFTDFNGLKRYFTAVKNEDFPENGILADYIIFPDYESFKSIVDKSLEDMDKSDTVLELNNRNILSFQVVDTGRKVIGEALYAGKLKDWNCKKKDKLLLGFLKSIDEAVKGPDNKNI